MPSLYLRGKMPQQIVDGADPEVLLELPRRLGPPMT